MTKIIIEQRDTEGEFKLLLEQVKKDEVSIKDAVHQIMMAIDSAVEEASESNYEKGFDEGFIEGSSNNVFDNPYNNEEYYEDF